MNRLAQRLHQPIRIGEHRDGVDQVVDLEVVHADLAQRPQIGRRDRLRFAREPGGEIDDGALSRLEPRAKSLVDTDAG